MEAVGVDRAKLHKVTRCAKLHRITYAQKAMYRPHYISLAMVNIDSELGSYIPSLVSILTQFIFNLRINSILTAYT